MTPGGGGEDEFAIVSCRDFQCQLFGEPPLINPLNSDMCGVNVQLSEDLAVQPESLASASDLVGPTKVAGPETLIRGKEAIKINNFSVIRSVPGRQICLCVAFLQKGKKCHKSK